MRQALKPCNILDMRRSSICLALVLSALSCKKGLSSGSSAEATHTLTIGGYTTIREVYSREILPTFRSELKKTKGVDVIFKESYLGSGAQSRAILSGFDADIASLSLEPDVQRLVNKGLVPKDWKTSAHHGIVSRSIVVIAVRNGNPKGIKDWEDLAKPGIGVLMPDPRTSGGARWSVLAIHGAATRQGRDGRAALAGILKNAVTLDKGARESMIAFESGVGDAAITYEHEAISSQLAGKTVDFVIPSHTILIENPAAIIEPNARAHNVLPTAQALLGFLVTPAAQAAFAKYGFRPIDAGASTTVFRPTQTVFTIADLGGWEEAQKLFDPGAVFDRALADARGHK